MAGFQTIGGVNAVSDHFGAAGGTQGVVRGVAVDHECRVVDVGDFRPAPQRGTTTDSAVSRFSAAAQVWLAESNDWSTAARTDRKAHV